MRPDEREQMRRAAEQAQWEVEGWWRGRGGNANIVHEICGEFRRRLEQELEADMHRRKD